MPSPRVLLFRSIISFVNLKHMARLLPGRALMWPCSRSGRDPHNDKSQNVFNLLTRQMRVAFRNQIFCPACRVVVERAHLVRGYELANGEDVRLTDAELEPLEAKRTANRTERIYHD
jgi:hypothetical protein